MIMLYNLFFFFYFLKAHGKNQNIFEIFPYRIDNSNIEVEHNDN